MLDGVVTWYVTCYFGRVPVQLLVDTGSHITMINKLVYDRIPNKLRPDLKPYQTELTAANGEVIHTYGYGERFLMALGKGFYSCDMVVADMGRLPGVIGMDFLNSVNATISCGTGALTIGNDIIECVNC